MADWNAALYLKFEDERTRPARDLLAQAPLTQPRRVVDLGCGPGNSTELLAARFPEADVVGLDSSPDMLKQARTRLPSLRFVQADLADWAPEPGTDLLFANAVFQWVPDHAAVLRRLLEALPEGGVLAAQMPDNLDEPSHVLMRETARASRFAARLATADEARGGLLTPGGYYDLVKPICRHVDVWHCVYNHALAGPSAIAEWFKSTALRPYLDPLNKDEREEYLAAYVAALARAYPPRVDGTALLRFPRLFIVAAR